MREYHPSLVAQLAVRKDASARHVLLRGQDKVVYKQCSLCLCWNGPSGKRKFLPNSNGYSRMVSVFCSSVFGFILRLIEEQLCEVNEKRKSKII